MQTVQCISIIFLLVLNTPFCTVIIVLYYRREAPPLKETLFCPIVKPSGFHIPSQQSAFSKCPLLKPYVNQPNEMALKTSKSSQDLSVVAANWWDYQLLVMLKCILMCHIPKDKVVSCSWLLLSHMPYTLRVFLKIAQFHIVILVV